MDTAPTEHRLVFDLGMVSSIDDVSRRMLREVVYRLRSEGHRVEVADPESVMGDRART
ncbi:hypothetical protein [Microbacterium sp. zg.Y909]|uniref:hypothetical protein n=1 Tax=Microbacterium sp. zg.Y909 TaxID=2969413 RepID=UPI00214C3D38|nr:hypothetical protein [Microbacterium sp. zg.Y909]MCR2824312.1 hypothetical protein [Microbacterium sp. zg.Y909]